MIALSPRQAAGAQGETAVRDPIPGDPVPARFALTVKELATLPKSDPVPAPVDPRLMRQARINHLGEVPNGSGRLFVVDLNGTLYFIDEGTPRPYLDVATRFAPDFWSGRGLGSGFGFVTFHPEFKRNGTFYTVHTEALDALESKTPDLYAQPNAVLHSVLTEWTATDPSANAFEGTSRELLRIAFATYVHAVQQIDFNPTLKRRDKDYGLLYVAVGDGGIGVTTDDPQNLAVPQGKILRIDPRGTNSANGKYGIPASNPFSGKPGVLGEIYAYGMRDPHRFSWDIGGRHRMFLGHIGEHGIEAVYEVKAGDNFGWSRREGSFVFKREDRCNLYTLPAADAQHGYTYPVAAYDHNAAPDWTCTRDVGRAISGGFVYRGRDVPALRGKYVFGDLVDGRIFYTNEEEMRRGGGLATIHDVKILDASGGLVTVPLLAGDTRADLRFGTDRKGELYLLAKSNGKVWKVTGAQRLPDLPDLPDLPEVLPSFRRNLVAYFDFEHPVSGKTWQEEDQGFSRTNITLVNGGAAMRVKDGAFPASTTSVQAQQINPAVAGNDDWKAGIYAATGVTSLNAFNAAQGVTIMGWFKMTGENPGLNSNSANPDDSYGAIGLAGVLTGDSDGHAVRALLEVIDVKGIMRVVALGRRIDGGSSQTYAADEDWRTVLPAYEWVFLAATFDFKKGSMSLYKNGMPLGGSYVEPGRWDLGAETRPYVPPTDPRGIKIGGSFPQNTREGNACHCRMDSLMFLDRVLSASEIKQQHHRMNSR